MFRVIGLGRGLGRGHDLLHAVGEPALQPDVDQKSREQRDQHRGHQRQPAKDRDQPCMQARCGRRAAPGRDQPRHARDDEPDQHDQKGQVRQQDHPQGRALHAPTERPHHRQRRHGQRHARQHDAPGQRPAPRSGQSDTGQPVPAEPRCQTCHIPHLPSFAAFVAGARVLRAGPCGGFTSVCASVSPRYSARSVSCATYCG